MTKPASAETERIRDLYDEEASGYDREIAFFEKLLFAGGREWVCSRARGDVLELAAGTGRNFAHYPADARLTAIELSPAMFDLARLRARDAGREVDCGRAMHGRSSFPTRASTPSPARWRSARSPTPAPPSPRRGASCAPADVCSCSSTSAARDARSAPSKGCWIPSRCASRPTTSRASHSNTSPPRASPSTSSNAPSSASSNASPPASPPDEVPRRRPARQRAG
jgi:hypothetical protein